MSPSPNLTLEFSRGSCARLSDEQSIDFLFQRMLDGDHAAFERIFHACYRYLCWYSRQFVICPYVAEEIVDDVLCSLWCNRKKLRINTSFRAYLIRCIRNRSLDCLRKKRGVRMYMLDYAQEIRCKQSIAHESLILDELRRQIDGAVDRLPTQRRAIFRMSREEDLSYKDIAARLKISVKTVDTQMCRALKQIRQAIAACG